MNWTNVDARWYSNSNVKAVPMYVFTVPEGTWSVEISTEGYQPTASTTDPNKGKVDGMIAYSDDQSEVWNVGINQNCNITNLKADNSWKYGHPDMEINNCHFNQGQVLEMDGTVSFHVETTGDNASFFLVGPAVQKLSKYNYAVSYGAWTDRDMELGLITVSLDERDESRGSALKRPRREGHSKAVSTWETINLPEKENSEKTETGQRQDLKTPVLIKTVSDSGSDAGSAQDNEIPDNLEDDPWGGITEASKRPETEDDVPPQETKSIGALERFKRSGKPPLRGPNRTVTTFQPESDLLEAWDPPHFNPGYTKEDVAAATILAGGDVWDGREMLQKRDDQIQRKRKSWVPSFGGSKTSTLQGGSLRQSKNSEALSHLTTEQRREYEGIKRQQGTTRASEFLKRILAGSEP
nr:P5 protein [Turnip yellows virus]